MNPSNHNLLEEGISTLESIRQRVVSLSAQETVFRGLAQLLSELQTQLKSIVINLEGIHSSDCLLVSKDHFDAHFGTQREAVSDLCKQTDHVATKLRELDALAESQKHIHEKLQGLGDLANTLGKIQSELEATRSSVTILERAELSKKWWITTIVVIVIAVLQLVTLVVVLIR